jgi:hypothetical protein
MANENPVQTKEIDFASLVRKVEGEDMNKKDEVYEFSNGRKFEDSGSNGGPYAS